MDFFTNCYIPSQKKEYKINKITFKDYFQLNSYIQNSDYIRINDTFNTICDKSIESSFLLTNLDKFVVLIHLKNIFLDHILKISGKNEKNDSIIYEVILKEIIDNCKKYNIENFKLPTELYYDDSNKILQETGHSVDEIKNHIDQNKILMFEIPKMITGIPKVYLNCFDNTLFYFCKLLYTTDLKNFYKKIAILKKQFNFLLSEIYDMSPKELDIFLNTK